MLAARTGARVLRVRFVTVGFWLGLRSNLRALCGRSSRGVNGFYQKHTSSCEGACAVAQAVLGFSGQFAEGLAVSLRHEKGVVPESTAAALRLHDAPFHAPAEGAEDAAFLGQADHAAKSARRGKLADLAQEPGAIFCICRS